MEGGGRRDQCLPLWNCKFNTLLKLPSTEVTKRAPGNDSFLRQLTDLGLKKLLILPLSMTEDKLVKHSYLQGFKCLDILFFYEFLAPVWTVRALFLQSHHILLLFLYNWNNSILSKLIGYSTACLRIIYNMLNYNIY